MNPLRYCRLWLAALAALTLVLTPQQKAAAQTSGNDVGWPRTYNLSNGGHAIVYQPQVASWEGQKHIVFWCAVAYIAPGAKKPALGTIKAEADTQVALEWHLVDFTNLKIDKFHFSTLSHDQASAFVTAFQKALPSGQVPVMLDHVLAYVDKSQIVPKRGEEAGIKADPPKIYVSTQPAILVMFDGEPIWTDIPDLDLKYAVNTNWDVFQQASTSAYFLRDNASWLKATDVHGPWTPAGTLPADFAKLPANANWKTARANLPGKPFSSGAVPTVFINFAPAEMILLQGAPHYEPIKGIGLLWVSNTTSDLFRMGQSGLFYYLVAGRWFSAATLSGPWTFATPTLPAAFKKIPLDFPRSRVLASVPGTDQAQEAVLLAQIPQTARVNVTQIKAPTVTYQGDPKFEPIPGTSLSRAVNTDKQVLKVGDLYYLCFQGVWFKSSTPSGPWEAARTVPQAIYSIPPSSPDYNVTYVTVQQSEPNDDWVDYSAAAGYMGAMVAWGCCVWGSGYYYPPYYLGGVYYPYASTYGIGAWYNPYTGVYGQGVGAYGPYGGVSAGAAYNPATGTYARGAAAYGPYGSRGYAQAYNPRTGAYGQTRQGSNVYGSWGSSSVQRGDQWAQTGHYTNNATGRTTSGARGSGGGAAVHTSGPGGSSTVARSGSGNMYAGHDGNVYSNQNGSWQKYNNGNWSNMQRPTGANYSTYNQLNRDQASRYEGGQRMNSMNYYQSRGGGWGSAGSYRGGGGYRGGGSRGGGRR